MQNKKFIILLIIHAICYWYGNDLWFEIYGILYFFFYKIIAYLF